MKNAAKGLISFIRILGVSALLAPVALAQEVQISSYLPMTLGNTWRFADTAAGNVEFELKVAEQVSVAGSPAFKVVRSDGGDYDIMSNDASGLRLHARKDKNGTIDWAPGVTFALAKAKVGETQTSNPNFTNPGTGRKMVWTAQFARLADVVVPAGTFKNCALLKVTVQDASLGTRFANFDLYLAPNVGIVKRQGQFFGVFFAQQLLRFTVR